MNIPGTSKLQKYINCPAGGDSMVNSAVVSLIIVTNFCSTVALSRMKKIFEEVKPEYSLVINVWFKLHQICRLSPYLTNMWPFGTVPIKSKI